MAGAETTWFWSVGIIAFAFGLVAGYVISYFTNPDHDRREELERELAEQKEETKQYRAQVSQHFQRTSELVQNMTDSYRQVYEHLATGSQQLCSDPVTTPRLDLPERERLASETTETASAETETDTATATAGEPQPDPNPMPKTGNDQDDYLGDAPYVPDLNLHLVKNEDKVKDKPKTGTDQS